MTYQQLKKKVEDKGFKFFDKGSYNLNIIYFRNNNVFTDKYTDTLYIAFKNGIVETLFEAPCSTKAGSYYVKNPITYLGIKGTAVMKEGQWEGCYQFIDNNSWLNTPYLKQIKPISIWRDGIIDGDIDEQNEQSGIFGINCHTAGDIKNIIYNWSAGCLVTPKEKWLQAINIIREGSKRYGNIFTVTLIENYN